MDRPVEHHAAAPAAHTPQPHEAAHLHVSGEAIYVDDIPELPGTLHAALGLSQHAHARITSIDFAAVHAAPGVVAVLTAKDIPGENNCGPIAHDDPIFAERVVHSKNAQAAPLLAAGGNELKKRSGCPAACGGGE